MLLCATQYHHRTGSLPLTGPARYSAAALFCLPHRYRVPHSRHMIPPCASIISRTAIIPHRLFARNSLRLRLFGRLISRDCFTPINPLPRALLSGFRRHDVQVLRYFLVGFARFKHRVSPAKETVQFQLGWVQPNSPTSSPVENVSFVVMTAYKPFRDRNRCAEWRCTEANRDNSRFG